MPKPALIGRCQWAALALVLLMAACTADAPTPIASPLATPMPPATATAPPAAPLVEPAPGSASAVYAPNPGAVVVAIDPGHGGCLDWGVADPSERGVQLAEKTLTLAIAERLRDRLEADGITVLMIREEDVALAGDDYPDLGCSGPPWRDVDGDGEAGFEETGRIRTRDELQARIDLANLARADAFVSIHINSLTQDGVSFEIAATQTFYDDESPWPVASETLATGLQDGVVSALDPIATYERQDRGTDAVAYYAISREWRDSDTCETAGDTWCKPHRALAMPGALAEVGSITLRQEHDLLATADGQDAVANGLFEGLVDFFAARELAGRIGLEGAATGAAPAPVDGDGPPFLAAPAPDGPIRLRLTNSGSVDWPPGGELVAAWEQTELPYLAAAPSGLAALDVELPTLSPGESVVLEVALPDAADGRSVAWISVRFGGTLLTDLGSPALQVSSRAD